MTSAVDDDPARFLTVTHRTTSRALAPSATAVVQMRSVVFLQHDRVILKADMRGAPYTRITSTCISWPAE